jgi:hypothetical protein
MRNDSVVRQTDIASTISSIIGMPIPSNNIGKIKFCLLGNIAYDFFIDEPDLLVRI